MGWFSSSSGESNGTVAGKKEVSPEERERKKAALMADLKERKLDSGAIKRNPNWFLMTPLQFAPLLPIIRITLRPYPKLRDNLFKLTLATAFGHSFLLATGFYNTSAYRSPEENKKD